MHKGNLIKFILLVAFIIAVLYLIKFSPLSVYLTREHLKEWINSFGVWAPIIFMLVYALAVSILIPASIMTAAGAIIFGPYLGFVYNAFGALCGACVAFIIARVFGRGFVGGVVGGRLARWDQKLETHGFATILYLRLLYFPFSALSFGAGLTKIRFTDFLLGTCFGSLIGGFILAFLFGNLGDVILRRAWVELFGWKIVLAILLFIFSLFIPRIVRGFKKYFVKNNGQNSS